MNGSWRSSDRQRLGLAMISTIVLYTCVAQVLGVEPVLPPIEMINRFAGGDAALEHELVQHHKRLMGQLNSARKEYGIEMNAVRERLDQFHSDNPSIGDAWVSKGEDFGAFSALETMRREQQKVRDAWEALLVRRLSSGGYDEWVSESRRMRRDRCIQRLDQERQIVLVDCVAIVTDMTVEKAGALLGELDQYEIAMDLALAEWETREPELTGDIRRFAVSAEDRAQRPMAAERKRKIAMKRREQERNLIRNVLRVEYEYIAILTEAVGASRSAEFRDRVWELKYPELVIPSPAHVLYSAIQSTRVWQQERWQLESVFNRFDAEFNRVQENLVERHMRWQLYGRSRDLDSISSLCKERRILSRTATDRIIGCIPENAEGLPPNVRFLMRCQSSQEADL